MPRMVSGLNYDEELALPMPKPRRSRGQTPEPDALFEDEEDQIDKSCFSKESSCENSPTCETPSTTSECKKRSRLQILKSKLSFKDLKREIAKEEISSPIPLPHYHDSTKPCLRRHPPNALIPPLVASTACSTKARPKADPVKPFRPEGSSTMSASSVSNTSTTPSRIPLPPSNTLSHEHGIMSSAKGPAGQRLSSGQRPPSYSSSASKSEKPESSIIDTTAGTITPVSCESHAVDIRTVRSNLEDSSASVNVAHSCDDQFRYPAISESPPRPDDLLEGTGKVKYIPKAWLDTRLQPTAPSSQPNGKENPHILNKAGENRNGLFSSRVPTLKERFEKPKAPAESSTSRGMAAQNEEIVAMVRSIQRHTDTGIKDLTQKLEELSTWINNQLNRHIQSITDLSRANSDLFSKQSEISREMMNFELAIRLEIGVMERHLNGFEMKLVGELQDEIRALAKSHEELNLKTDALIRGSSTDETRRFMEVQHMKNSEIEREIAFLKAHTLTDCSLPVPSLPIPMPSESSMCSTDPLIKTTISLIKQSDSSIKSSESAGKLKSKPTTADLGVLAIGATHPPMLPPRTPIKASTSGIKRSPAAGASMGEANHRETNTGDSEPANLLPRSVSLNKKGLLKNLKSGSPDQGQPKGGNNGDEPKKWSLFNFRRRHAAIESSPRGNGKAPLPSVQMPVKVQAEHLDNVKDRSSTGSSTPPLPAVPVQFKQTHNIDRVSIHPALRSIEMPNTISLKKRQMNRPRPIDVSSAQRCPFALGTTTEACPFPPTTGSSDGGVLIPAADKESSSISVPETEVKVSESDEEWVEERPLLGGDDEESEWNSVRRPKTNGQDNESKN